MKVPANSECPDCKGVHLGSDFDCLATTPVRIPDPMKPTQKQPEPLKNVAVTRDCKCLGEFHSHQCEIRKLQAERDEAIREVERLKEEVAQINRMVMESKGATEFDKGWIAHRIAGDYVSRAELEAEKRQTAAYRELAIDLWVEIDSAYDCPKEGWQITAMRKDVDAEAQKLLADSGGEKEKS